ncbi:hypothetical protein [Conexivisphaera calida]|nr:hypothetical protein [Conexivisphaera calida]
MDPLNIPEDALKEYTIKVDVHGFEFINQDNFSEIIIKKPGMLSKEYAVLEGESAIGKLKYDTVKMKTEIYDDSGDILLGTIEKPEPQNKIFNPFDPKGISKVREYLVEDPAGKVTMKTVSEKATHTIELIYNVVDESGVVARFEPPQKIFGRQEYHLHIYLQKLRPIMLAALFLSIRMGEMAFAAGNVRDAFYPF